MKKRKHSNLVIIMVVICIVVVGLTAESSLKKRIENRAYQDIYEYTKLQTSHILNSLELQQDSLEALAYYISEQENFDISEEQSLLNAFVRGGRFLTLGFVNLDGASVSFRGEPLGNMSDHDFFREIVYQNSYRSIEYFRKSEMLPEPFILLSVPIIKDNRMEGLLFACKTSTILKDAILSNGSGGVNTILVDSSGNIIVQDEDNAIRFSEANIFEEYPSKKIFGDIETETIESNMLTFRSDAFYVNRVDNQENQYVLYMPAGMNDWYLLNTVSGEIFHTKYSFTGKILFLSLCALTVIVITSYIGLILWNRRTRKALLTSRASDNGEKKDPLIPIPHEPEWKNQGALSSAVEEWKQREEITDLRKTVIDFLKDFAKKPALIFIVHLSTGDMEYKRDDSLKDFTYVHGGESTQKEIRSLIQEIVHEEDREALLLYINGSNIVKELHTGNYRKNMDFRCKNCEGAELWCNVQTHFEQDPETQERKLHFVLTHIDDPSAENEELMSRTERDSLTGLLNQEGFEARINWGNIRAEKEISYHAVIMLDIDNLKKINETFGLDTGDQVLIEAAKRIKGSLRGNDVVARFGEDEFITLLPAMPSIELINQRCLRICSNLSYAVKEDQVVTASLGVAISPEDGDSYEELLEKARTAMKAVIQKGGNGCARFGDDGIIDILPEMDDTGYATKENTHIFARTFGYFDLFLEGEPVYFTGAKEKELLAILIDRRGGTLTSDEAVSILWPDEPAGEKQLARYRKVAMRLKNTLQKLGIEDILTVNYGVRNIDISKIKSDYFDFLDGDKDARAQFNEAYMLNYSWAEETTAKLSNMINK